MAEISNSDNVIDSRDVIARIAHLSQLREPGPVDMGDDSDTNQDTLFEELASLEALAEQASQYAADWEYGEALIRDSYFETYARELADDIGAIDKDAGWPTMHIDWEAAAEALQQDYTEVDFDGVTYWIR